MNEDDPDAAALLSAAEDIIDDEFESVFRGEMIAHISRWRALEERAKTEPLDPQMRADLIAWIDDETAKITELIERNKNPDG